MDWRRASFSGFGGTGGAGPDGSGVDNSDSIGEVRRSAAGGFGAGG